jgi:hypothetical protein
MRLRTIAQRLLVACILLAPSLAAAETNSQAYNGATCIGYPAYNTSNHHPYSYWMYGFGQSAYCHFTVPSGWSVHDLSYVLFQGIVGSASPPLRARLCVYVTGSSAVCGTESTISAGGSVNWVSPPASVPTWASGAYLYVRFPDGYVSVFHQFVPVFVR